MDVDGCRMWHREGGEAPDLAHAEGRELGEVLAGGIDVVYVDSSYPLACANLLSACICWDVSPSVR